MRRNSRSCLLVSQEAGVAGRLSLPQGALAMTSPLLVVTVAREALPSSGVDDDRLVSGRVSWSSPGSLGGGCGDGPLEIVVRRAHHLVDGVPGTTIRVTNTRSLLDPYPPPRGR